MLQEILDRGYSEQSKQFILDDGMFHYVDPLNTSITTVPDRRLFVLEGLPGAGKTFIKNAFGKNDSFDVVDQILPNNPDNDKNLTLEDIFRSDETKTQVFKSSKRSNVIFDRYYVSTLAYSWAHDKIFKTNIYEKTITWYEHSLKSGRLIKPFIVFVIEIPIDFAFSRKDRIPNSDSSNPWMRTDFLEQFIAYYQYFYTDIEKKTNVIKIDGTKPLKEIIKQIHQYEKK